MKKHLIMALMAAFAAFTFCSCGDDEPEPNASGNNNGSNADNKVEASIVGEWSGIRPDEVLTDSSDVYVHFNFKADGTFEQIMPAWEEKDYGKYTVSGNVVTCKLTSLSWLWDRNNGYDNVYDQYGCYWYPDKYDEDRKKYEDPFAKFAKEWPGRVDFSAKYSFDKNGNLHLETLTGEGAGFGLELVYHKNPGYKPQRRAELD